MATSRYSSQRAAILENLQSRIDHPSADVIYTDIKKTMPTISLGTVYRNLQVLCDNGQVRKISFSDQIVHYDANMANHHHFVCKKCHSIYDIEISTFQNENIEHSVETVEVVYHGICNACQEK